MCTARTKPVKGFMPKTNSLNTAQFEQMISEIKSGMDLITYVKTTKNKVIAVKLLNENKDKLISSGALTEYEFKAMLITIGDVNQN